MFTAKLLKYPGAGGWTFAQIPDRHAVPVTHPWGRTPVFATVDGKRWATSVWSDRKHGTLLAVPAKIGGEKGAGDSVRVLLEPRGAVDVPVRARAKSKARGRRAASR